MLCVGQGHEGERGRSYPNQPLGHPGAGGVKRLRLRPSLSPAVRSLHAAPVFLDQIDHHLFPSLPSHLLPPPITGVRTIMAMLARLARVRH